MGQTAPAPSKSAPRSAPQSASVPPFSPGRVGETQKAPSLIEMAPFGHDPRETRSSHHDQMCELRTPATGRHKILSELRDAQVEWSTANTQLAGERGLSPGQRPGDGLVVDQSRGWCLGNLWRLSSSRQSRSQDADEGPRGILALHSHAWEKMEIGGERCTSRLESIRVLMKPALRCLAWSLVQGQDPRYLRSCQADARSPRSEP